MNIQELKLEVLKIAAREDVCHGNINAAVEAAEKMWLFLKATERGQPETVDSGPR